MKKNILIVVDNLIMGGVTKVLNNMLLNLDYTKYNVDLLVLHYYKSMDMNIPDEVRIIEGGKFFNVVDENIKKILKEKNVFKLIKKAIFSFSIKTNLMKYYIKMYRKKHQDKIYDTEIAYNDGFCHIYTAYGNTNKKIAWLHSDVMVMDYSQRHKKTMKKALDKMDLYISVSDKVGISYEQKYKIKNHITIPNFINENEIIKKSHETIEKNQYEDSIHVVSVGRLDYSKNYEMLIRVHKKLIDQGYKIYTSIVGDGMEREKLEALIKELSITESFKLIGQKQNPYPYIKNSDLFVLTSRYEGLPTVILEALTLHVPCISTEVAGVKEILKENYGIVTENSEEDFYKSFKYILDNKEIINEYKANLKTYKYDNKEIVKKIEKIL